MVKLKNIKKGQSLPLNTIVIAILVIIVLLVIIVFFTSKVGDTSQQLDNQGSVTKCDIGSNPTISALGYKSAQQRIEADCTGDWEVIRVVPKETKDGTDYICCGTKK